MLLDMVAYGFHIQDVPWTYNEFFRIYIDTYGNYFGEVFDIEKRSL